MFFAKKLVKFFSAALAASMFSFGAAFAAGGKVDVVVPREDEYVVAASFKPREGVQRWDFKFKNKGLLDCWKIGNSDEFYITQNSITGNLEVHHPDRSFPLYKLKTFSDHWEIFDWENFKDCDIHRRGDHYALVNAYSKEPYFLMREDNSNIYALYRRGHDKRIPNSKIAYIGCGVQFSDPTSTAPAGLLPLAMFFILHYGCKAV